MNKIDEEKMFEYMKKRNENLTDKQFIERINNAPDMGGSLLVELSEFVERFQKKQENLDNK